MSSSSKIPSLLALHVVPSCRRAAGTSDRACRPDLPAHGDAGPDHDQWRPWSGRVAVPPPPFPPRNTHTHSTHHTPHTANNTRPPSIGGVHLRVHKDLEIRKTPPTIDILPIMAHTRAALIPVHRETAGLFQGHSRSWWPVKTSRRLPVILGHKCRRHRRRRRARW